MHNPPDCFIPFQHSTEAYALPDRFTFPFHYQPHALSRLAAEELQDYLLHQANWEHNFGLEAGQDDAVYGKMFGVLVVKTESGELGYLAAFSGKLAGKNHHPWFVPPVFDLLDEAGFYRKEEERLSAMNRQIEQLEQAPAYLELGQKLLEETRNAEQSLAAAKQELKQARERRNQQREQAQNPEELQQLEETLTRESMRDHFVLKDLKKQWKQRLEDLKAQFDPLEAEIRALKDTRKTGSATLQQRIFDHYSFLNRFGQSKSLANIFQANAAAPPPAGAGECAAPKLLQYAFRHGLQPLAMAEFWWGASPATEIRKHQQFYPACRGKCAPILAHMLEGMDLDPNPLANSVTSGGDIEILYEDDQLWVLNKPAFLLSVPGKEEIDSVYFRIKRQFPEATGPLIVHRLDMATSGLMVLAKTAEVHKALQAQFLQRSVKKRYVADLEGVLTAEEGVIDLPLRVDLNDRPRQMVCFEYGKPARSLWKVVSRSATHTRVHFFPVTGRTHQLRVHAAHPRGLNAPIIGDDLYGNPADRLHLHADFLEFTHPASGESRSFQVDPPF